MKVLITNHDISYQLVTIISMYNVLKNNPYHGFANILIEKDIHYFVMAMMIEFKSNVKYQAKACRLLATIVDLYNDSITEELKQHLASSVQMAMSDFPTDKDVMQFGNMLVSALD